MSSITVPLEKFGKALEKQIKDYQKQVRFAAMNAINDLAFKDVRKNLTAAYEHTFRVRNKSFPRAIQIKKATKENLVAEVSYKADFMKLHTTGGIREPEGNENKTLSIPIENDVTVKHTAKGTVRERDRATGLLKYANESNFKKSKGHSAVKHAFILKKNAGGTAVIMKRAKTTTKKKDRYKGNEDTVFYALKDKAKIEKRWDFDRIVEVTANRHLLKYFKKRLDEAIRTAK